MSPAQLFRQAIGIAPSFEPVLAEHLSDNDGELLPHLLMGDLLRFVGARVGKQANDSVEVVLLLDLLEREVAGGNADTENVIAVSFLEDLEAEEFFPALYPLLGPRLRAALSLAS